MTGTQAHVKGLEVGSDKVWKLLFDCYFDLYRVGLYAF